MKVRLVIYVAISDCVDVNAIFEVASAPASASIFADVVDVAADVPGAANVVTDVVAAIDAVAYDMFYDNDDV